MKIHESNTGAGINSVPLFLCTHNGAIATLQVGLVIDVHNSGQEILRTEEGREEVVFYLLPRLPRTGRSGNVRLTDKVFPEPV